MSENQPHDEFLELCAASTSGELSEQERKRLEEHLAGCQACRTALREYQVILDEAIPALAAHEDIEDVTPGPGWSPKEAEKIFFERLEKNAHTADRPLSPYNISGARQQPRPNDNGPTWRQVWSLYVAGILLLLSLGFYAYRVHFPTYQDQSVPPARSKGLEEKRLSFSLEEQLSEVGREREVEQAAMRQRDELIADLRRRLAEGSAQIAQMKATQERWENDVRESGREAAAQRQSELEGKLERLEANARNLQGKVTVLSEQSAQDAARVRALEAKTSELTRLLEDREVALERQDQLLAHDKDIRDLIGARELYIAEVYDIARTGETRKPYGRVFYTRGKSLIFYAYDLDQETEAKKASSFQVWGRRGPDRQQALNLGIFYQDNLGRNQWILKCEDAKTLGQIDGVFVTIEPNGGSQKPSGKSLLSAYLKLDPNHP